MSTTAPFAPFEWMIAWRYLRARRAEGGVSVMTWISFVGIALAVFALVATLAIRAGLRSDFLDQMLGANAHVELRFVGDVSGSTLIDGYADLADRVAALPGVVDAAPLVRAQVLGSFQGRNAPVDVYGIRAEDLWQIPMIDAARQAGAAVDRFDDGIALGAGLAGRLGLGVGDRVKLTSPDGMRTAFGTSPRSSVYEVVFVFSAGQGFIDDGRAYLPLAAAQAFFNREGRVDQIDIRLTDPEEPAAVAAQIAQAGGPRAYAWTWQNRFGDMFRALRMQDNAIFVVLAILILIATLNIVSGLIMLVKNKGRDIGILRTMGLSQGSVLRVFFLCGALVGTAGTVFGILLGVLFAQNIDHVYALVDWLSGSGVAQLQASGFIFPSAVLEPGDILATAALSLGLSWFVTYFPARRAARMNPVEALRYE